MRAPDLYAAADGNENLRQVLESQQQQIDQLTKQTGANAPSQSVPEKASLFVQGIDGTFIIQITNPGDIAPLTIVPGVPSDGVSGGTIFHQVQSATGPTFDDSTAVVTYPTTTNTRLDITDPNKTYYWRVRSSADGTTWNEWSYLESAAVCGVVPVWSGLMRPVAVMPSATTKDGNFATVDSIAGGGGTATIRVYGTGGPGTMWTAQRGSSVVGPYPSGTISGQVVNTTYIIMYQPPDPVTGLGEQFYALTALPPSMADTLIYVGTVKTIPVGAVVATGTPIFSADPAPTKVITGVNITAAGTGYSEAPLVQFNGDATGAGAAATAVIDASGTVTGVVMTNQGAGYTGNGTVAFVGGQTGIVGGGGATGDNGGRYGLADVTL